MSGVSAIFHITDPEQASVPIRTSNSWLEKLEYFIIRKARGST